MADETAPRTVTDTAPLLPPSTVPVGRAALIGAVAAAVALTVGEVVSGLLGTGPSPVAAVGGEFVDRFAAALKDLAVALFGTNDKVTLLVGIVVISITVGALLGIAARRRRWVLPLGLGVFGTLGAVATATDPQGEVGEAVITAVAAVAVGTATGFGLLRLAARPATRSASTISTAAAGAPATGSSAIADTTSGVTDGNRVDAAGSGSGRQRTIRVDRRGFVLGLGGAAIGIAAGNLLARRLRDGEAVEAQRRSTVLPNPRRSTLPPARQPFEVAGLTPYVTPVGDFYRIDTALRTPLVDADRWRLRIDGLVAQPFELTYADLLALDPVEETATIQCVSNEVGGRLVGNAVWQGVPLTALLERAGVQPDATQVVGHSVDGWTAGFPTGLALDGRTALVAYAMNGEPLTSDHGFPARLVVAGLYGYVSATKWLERIELTTWEAHDGYWIPRGWAKEGPIKTTSRIDVPRQDATLAAGTQAIAGVAWAPGIGIERVEVRIDEGEWRECELGDVASDDTWVQWRLAWDAPPGGHVLEVRATDRTGAVQTGEVSDPAPDGATGWHRRPVRVT